MDQLLAFGQENLILIVVAIIAILIIAAVVKTLIKWVIIIAVIAAILIYGFNYSGETIKEIGQHVVEVTKDEALQMLFGEAKEAKYKQNQDGTFMVETPNLKLDGKVGSNDAKLTYKGFTINLKLDETLKRFIDQVKASSK